MKKNLFNIILVFIFLTGLSVLLYPAISDYVNSKTQTCAIADYDEMLSEMKEENFDEMFARAEQYNEYLKKNSDCFYHPEQAEGYSDLLNVGGTGIMGYISIDKIRVELPIYHGTDEGVLQIAAGHLEGTSLPTGGAGTHCVISAHRGLPSAKLFTNLDDLEVGDTFCITVLNRVLTYEVDRIRIVEPQEVDELKIVGGEDYCTLLTCTPYGVNSHRLLVRGRRIETSDERGHIFVANDAYRIDPLIVTPVAAAPMLLILLIILMVKYRKKK